ncbi:hypothetical protein [Peribacillus frigoritolerans]|uniref:hypothetical protein n=1 Tax=Peribacillus frigoritolerans TaxID=450367 RepID=UPI002231103D|nr:hypothetical protein [Peribacillus frigoritolerans]MDM5312181.1 hypothetical protein [Peribacillus frigoritolerans]UZD46421.1 hypothetical protein OMJ04_23055 [Peribacillus frigoritolerans]
MKRICNQCQTEMIDDCKVNVQDGMNGIKINQKKELFNSVSSNPKGKHLYAQIVVM